jgi:predicted N-acetyltransferase YhbS
MPPPDSAGAVVSLSIRPERPQDAAIADYLIADAFGPGRFVKSAERLREGARPLADLSFIAWEGAQPVGCVRLWPVTIGSAPALLLGPFAVASHHRSRGLGAALIETACDTARAGGHGVVVLVGAAAYFVRLGFEPVPRGLVTLPGPVDPARVLWRALQPGALEGVHGPVLPGPSRA